MDSQHSLNNRPDYVRLASAHAHVSREAAGSAHYFGTGVFGIAAVPTDVGPSLRTGEHYGALCISPLGIETTLEATSPILRLELDLEAWRHSVGLPKITAFDQGLYIGPCPPLIQSSAKLLSEMCVPNVSWQPIHDGLIAIILDQIVPDLWFAEDHAPFSSEITKALALVDQDLANPLPLERLARATNWSPFHFARRFKAETGESPSRYVRLRRVERAQRLLIETDLALCDIALSTGFTSQSQMTTAFATILGITPAKFRQSGRKLKRLAPRLP